MVYALGQGFASAVRSLATSLVEPHHIGRLNSYATTIDMVGSLAAGPLLSTAYGAGLELGGAWVGLPFLLSGVSYFAVGGPLFVAGLREYHR